MKFYYILSIFIAKPLFVGSMFAGGWKDEARQDGPRSLSSLLVANAGDGMAEALGGCG
jgi:hypothetical protein